MYDDDLIRERSSIMSCLYLFIEAVCASRCFACRRFLSWVYQSCVMVVRVWDGSVRRERCLAA